MVREVGGGGERGRGYKAWEGIGGISFVSIASGGSQVCFFRCLQYENLKKFHR